MTSYPEVPLVHGDLGETSDDYEVQSLHVGTCGLAFEAIGEVSSQYFLEKIRTNFTGTTCLDETDRRSKYNVRQLIIRRKSDVAQLANLNIEEMAKIERKPLNRDVVNRIFKSEKEKDMQRMKDSIKGWSDREKRRFNLDSRIK